MTTSSNEATKAKRAPEITRGSINGTTTRVSVVSGRARTTIRLARHGIHAGVLGAALLARSELEPDVAG